MILLNTIFSKVIDVFTLSDLFTIVLDIINKINKIGRCFRRCSGLTLTYSLAVSLQI